MAGHGLFFDAPFGLPATLRLLRDPNLSVDRLLSLRRVRGDPAAIAMANACALKLIALQGPQGEWPWFFDAVERPRAGLLRGLFGPPVWHGSGAAGMGGASRRLAGRANALIKGFKWVFGDNQLGAIDAGARVAA